MSQRSEEEKQEMERNPFREAIIGSLMYLLAMIRGDIAYAVNQLAAFVYDPSRCNWEALKQFLSYLAGTINHGICFGGTGINRIRPRI